jgi:ubiquinol-cytochrome c reductase cytochrome c subunit
MTRISVIAMLLAACSAGPALAQQSAVATPASGDAARGKKLFMADGCYECHGTVGQGGPGARLAPSPLPPQVIGYYIRNPTGEMPPFTSKVVSDADIRDIHAYLSSIPKPPAVADIPELN